MQVSDSFLFDKFKYFVDYFSTREILNLSLETPAI